MAPQTSFAEVEHRPLRVVLRWGTEVVGYTLQELELIMWPVIINGFGICQVFVCAVP